MCEERKNLLGWELGRRGRSPDAGEIKRLQTASLNMEGKVERGRNGTIDLQPLSKAMGLVLRDEGSLEEEKEEEKEGEELNV